MTHTETGRQIIKRWRNLVQIDANKQADINERLRAGETVTFEATSGPGLDHRTVCATELDAFLERLWELTKRVDETWSYGDVRDAFRALLGQPASEK